MKEKNNNLKSIRKEHGYTVKEVVDGTGIPMRTYQNYEYMEREIGAGALQKLADFYGVTIDYLLGRPEATPPIDPISQIDIDDKEKAALSKWVALDAKKRHMVLDVMADIVHSYESAQRQAIVHTFPIQIQISMHKVSAGTGYDLEDGDAWKTIDIADTETARNADFGLEVEGDSMEPKYHNGDIILISKTPAVDIGDDCVYTVNGAGYVKQYGGDRLISLNKDYDDIYFHDYDYDSIHCVGKVIGVAERV